MGIPELLHSEGGNSYIPHRDKVNKNDQQRWGKSTCQTKEPKSTYL